VSRAQLERVLGYIESAKSEGARLLCGGNRPSDPRLAGGFFVEPTVFADVTRAMRIAREEIFGPVLAILKWSNESRMLDEVNAVDYGLTCSIWTNDLSTAHRTAMAVCWLCLDQRSRQVLLGCRSGGASSNRDSAARSASRSCCASRRRRTSM
jgi:betaine-aldehyde dehydrogenase